MGARLKIQLYLMCLNYLPQWVGGENGNKGNSSSVGVEVDLSSGWASSGPIYGREGHMVGCNGM